MTYLLNLLSLPQLGPCLGLPGGTYLSGGGLTESGDNALSFILSGSQRCPIKQITKQVHAPIIELIEVYICIELDFWGVSLFSNPPPPLPQKIPIIIIYNASSLYLYRYVQKATVGYTMASIQAKYNTAYAGRQISESLKRNICLLGLCYI